MQDMGIQSENTEQGNAWKSAMLSYPTSTFVFLLDVIGIFIFSLWIAQRNMNFLFSVEPCSEMCSYSI